MLAGVANWVPVFKPFVAKRYRTQPADVFFRMDSGETRTIASSSGVQQRDPMGPAMFCLALQPGLKRFREEIEGEVETSAYMNDVSVGLLRITANTIRAFAFLRRELEDIGIVVNTSKTVALSPKGHAPTAEDISLLESVDVCVADEAGVTVVGVPIGTDEYVLERAREIVKEGGTDHRALHAASPTCRTNKRRPSSSSNPSGRGLTTSKGSRHRAVPRSMQKGRQRGAVGI